MKKRKQIKRQLENCIKEILHENFLKIIDTSINSMIINHINNDLYSCLWLELELNLKIQLHEIRHL